MMEMDLKLIKLLKSSINSSRFPSVANAKKIRTFKMGNYNLKIGNNEKTIC
jgi:hypothetical protein